MDLMAVRSGLGAGVIGTDLRGLGRQEAVELRVEMKKYRCLGVCSYEEWYNRVAEALRDIDHFGDTPLGGTREFGLLAGRAKEGKKKGDRRRR